MILATGILPIQQVFPRHEFDFCSVFTAPPAPGSKPTQLPQQVHGQRGPGEIDPEIPHEPCGDLRTHESLPVELQDRFLRECSTGARTPTPGLDDAVLDHFDHHGATLATGPADFFKSENRAAVEHEQGVRITAG